MTKVRKKKVLATRQVKSAKSAVKSANRQLTKAEHKVVEANMAEQIAEVNARRDEEIAAIRASYAKEHVAVPSRLPNVDLLASLNAQVVQLQSQIAALTAGGLAPTAYSLPPTASSLAPTASSLAPIASSLAPTASSDELRAQLPQPEITFMQATGPHTILVKWNAVPNAASYSFKYSTDPNVMIDVEAKYPHATDTQVTLDALLPNTTYYAHIKANAGAGNTESAYSITKAATTPVAGSGGGGDGCCCGGNGGGGCNGGNGGGGDGGGGCNGGGGGTDVGENAANLQCWLNTMEASFKHVACCIPQLGSIVLTPVERRRLMASGVKRYGFVDQLSDTSAEFPQFWPASSLGTDGMQSRLKNLLRELEVLRNLIIWLRRMLRAAGDLRLTVGNEAFRLANSYYNGARAAARSRVPEAQQVFELLKQFWKQRNRVTDNPTEGEAVRDFNAVAHGKKEGYVAAEYTRDRAAKGKKVLVDETRSPRQRGGERVDERETNG